MNEVEEFIREVFDENFELLRLEGGHSLAADVRDTALQQVLLYWRKMRDVAEHVTDTEVKLTLPRQTSPKGRGFSIEGVVDIVQEEERTVMYDVKTHDADYVRSHTDIYQRQLNVYAHIWQNLREHALDQTAIIATAYPDAVKEALANGDDASLEQALEAWEPLIDLPFEPERVEDTIADFGRVVDAIEDGVFAPPDVETLREIYKGTNSRFATRVCRNCDARFSCDTYRRYSIEGRGGSIQMRQYFRDLGTDLDQNDWIAGGLDNASPDEDLE